VTGKTLHTPDTGAVPYSESVLSGYLSLSSSAPHLFGDRLDDFAGEVRALLANRSRYYPGRDRVIGWFNAAGLQIIDEGFSQEDGRGYRHFLLQKTGR
jgi:hypothetical protein